MGGKIQGVVTNETKGTVYYTVTNHYLKIDSQSITHNPKINASFEVEGKQGQAFKVDSDKNVNFELNNQIGGKGKIGGGYDYKN